MIDRYPEGVRLVADSRVKLQAAWRALRELYDCDTMAEVRNVSERLSEQPSRGNVVYVNFGGAHG